MIPRNSRIDEFTQPRARSFAELCIQNADHEVSLRDVPRRLDHDRIVAVLELHLDSQLCVPDDDLGPRVLCLESEELAQRRGRVPPHPLAAEELGPSAEFLVSQLQLRREYRLLRRVVRLERRRLKQGSSDFWK